MECYNLNNQQVDKIWLEIQHPLDNVPSFIIGTIYRHPSSNFATFSDALSTSLNMLNSQKKTFFIMGDLNINLLSESQPTLDYIQMLNSSGTVPLITLPTRVTGHCSTLLDHIYTNLTKCVIYPSVIDLDLTDHYPVMAKILVKTNDYSSRTHYKRVYTDNAKDELLVAAFDHFDANELKSVTLANLNDRFDGFLKKLVSLINSYFPLRRVSRQQRKLQTKPWITPGILRSIKKRNHLHKTWYLNGTEYERRQYKIYANRLNRIKAKAKKSYYTRSFNQHKNNSKETWKIIRKLISPQSHSNFPSSIADEHGNEISDAQRVSTAFNQYFTSIGPRLQSRCDISPTTGTIYPELRSSSMDSMFLTPTDEIEVAEVIGTLNNGKAEGYDKLPIELLKVVTPAIVNHLAYFFNHCVEYGIFPRSLKIGRVVPIHKKGDKLKVCNYRPITVLSCLSTLFEKLLHKRLHNFISPILCSKQFGFRTNHNTSHAMLNLLINYHSTILSNEIGCSIYLDLQMAFDTVNHTILLKKLYGYGVRGKPHDLFTSYLLDRKQYVSHPEKDSSMETIVCGVPQGLVLGPLLFTIYLNDLVNSTNFSVTLFADDTCLYASSSSYSQLCHLVSTEMQQVNLWMEVNKLTINPSKTQMLLINTKAYSYIDLPPFLILNNTPITPITEAKYLGLVIDDKLSWKPLVKQLCSKLSRSVGILSKIRHFLPKSVLRSVYFSIIQCHLQYGIIFWGLTFKTEIRKVVVLQNKAIRMILGAKLDENLSPYYKALKILKVEDLCKYEIAKLMFKYHRQELPDAFSDLFTRTSNIHRHQTRSATASNFFMPRMSSTSSQRFITYAGAKIWNEEVPAELRLLPPEIYNRKLLAHIIRKY